MVMDIKQAIEKAVKTFGMEILKDSKLIGILSDYEAFDDMPCAKNMLRQIYQNGYGAKMYKLYQNKNEGNAFFHELRDNFGYDLGIVKKVFSVFSLNAANTDVEKQKNNPAQKKSSFLLKVGDAEMLMIYVQGGTFNMGSDDKDAKDDEKPVHPVTLDDFYISADLVTLSLCAQVGFVTDHYGYAAASWNDIFYKIIPALNKKTGKKFSLPTEAQWEYAARGGRGSMGFKYSGGYDIAQIYRDGATNELGICNMSGIQQWCFDKYSNYSGTPVTNPQGAEYGLYQVVRGGKYDTITNKQVFSCRVSARYTMYPNDKAHFRLCLNA